MQTQYNGSFLMKNNSSNPYCNIFISSQTQSMEFFSNLADITKLDKDIEMVYRTLVAIVFHNLPFFISLFIL